MMGQLKPSLFTDLRPGKGALLVARRSYPLPFPATWRWETGVPLWYTQVSDRVSMAMLIRMLPKVQIFFAPAFAPPHFVRNSFAVTTFGISHFYELYIEITE